MKHRAPLLHNTRVHENSVCKTARNLPKINQLLQHLLTEKHSPFPTCFTFNKLSCVIPKYCTCMLICLLHV